MSDLFNGEFTEQKTKSGNAKRADEFVLAYASYKKENPKIELLEMDSEQNMMAIRARMPEPFRSEHLDTLRKTKLNCSRAGRLSNRIILGNDKEETKAAVWSVSSASNWLNDRSVQISPEYQRFLDSIEWYNFARSLKELENWHCQMCHRMAINGTLHAHHVKPDKELRLTKSNIWIVCESCHSIIHFVRDRRRGVK
jgi:hypothetical protein